LTRLVYYTVKISVLECEKDLLVKILLGAVL